MLSQSLSPVQVRPGAGYGTSVMRGLVWPDLVAVACGVGDEPGRAQRLRRRVSPTGAHDAAPRAPRGHGDT